MPGLANTMDIAISKNIKEHHRTSKNIKEHQRTSKNIIKNLYIFPVFCWQFWQDRDLHGFFTWSLHRRFCVYMPENAWNIPQKFWLNHFRSRNCRFCVPIIPTCLLIESFMYPPINKPSNGKSTIQFNDFLSYKPPLTLGFFILPCCQWDPAY